MTPPPVIDEDRVSSAFPIDTPCSLGDKVSLLLLQEAVVALLGDYQYFEIGSGQGGSLYPHLVQARCTRAYSLDPRPWIHTGTDQMEFPGPTSSKEMAKTLFMTLCGDTQLKKLTAIEATSDAPHETFREAGRSIKAHFFFWDGDPTWFRSDFELCLRLSPPQAVYVVQGAPGLASELREMIGHVLHLTDQVMAYPLVDTLFVITKNLPLHRYTPLQAHLLEYGHLPYLTALQAQEKYQAFYRRPLFRWWRGLVAMLSGKRA